MSRVLHHLPGLDLELIAQRLADGIRGGRHRATRRGRGVEFAQHRSYGRGDDVRLVDWKAYGRTDRLLIREAEIEADHRFWIILDTSGSMAARSDRDGTSKFSAASAVAAGLGAVAERQGDDYALAVLGRRNDILLAPSQGQRCFTRLVATLDGLQADGRIEPGGLAGLRPIAAEGRSADVFVLTDGYQRQRELTELVRMLAVQSNAVQLICFDSGLERAWMLDHSRRLEDLETGDVLEVDPAAGRAFVRDRERALQHWARDLAASGVGFSRFNVDDPWRDQFRRLLEAR